MTSLQSAVGESSHPRSGGHQLQFYDHSDFLVEAVARFLLPALLEGETAIAVARAHHLRALRRSLAARGIDLALAEREGRLILADAAETLQSLLVDGKIDEARVKARMDRLLGNDHRPGLRIFGEMVDLLMAQGNVAEARHLEEVWEERLHKGGFQLLCGYSMVHFPRDADTRNFEDLCDLHGRVLPLEAATPDADDRRMAWLEQRARALETEIGSRRELEKALREALAQRDRTEDALRTSRDQLARTLRFSETFVGVLGHDLRNPLSAVTIAASLLVRRAESDGISRPAGRILASAGRMSRMIDQLLDFTRIRLGKGLPLTPAEADLATVCSAVIDELDADRDRVRLQSFGPVDGFWDRDRLAQLVSNLVSNALAHGDTRGIVTVNVDGTSKNHVGLTVHNEGAVPEDVLPRLFDAFESTADLKSEGASGLGLGLYISRQVVVAHGGTIEVLSSLPAGTTFQVDLPRRSWVPEASERAESQDRPGGG